MEDTYYAEAWGWIRSNPGAFARLLIPKYRRLFSPLSVASYLEDYDVPGASALYIIYGVFLLAAGCGALIVWPNWRRIGLFYAPLAGVILSVGLFYGDVRYTLPMAPSLVVFAAVTVDKVLTRLSRGLICSSG